MHPVNPPWHASRRPGSTLAEPHSLRYFVACVKYSLDIVTAAGYAVSTPKQVWQQKCI
jgi:hypothetical protein